MAVTVDELRTWLARFDKNHLVGVDEDGLVLVVVMDGIRPYLEVGGLPEDDAPPAPQGMRKRNGVEYGCGRPDCLACYERIKQ